MAENSTTINVEPGVLDTLKATLNPATIMKKLNINSNTLIYMALYLGVGFVAGYLLKRYGKFVIVLILGVLLLLLLQQLGLITIICNPEKFQELFGITPAMGKEENLLIVYWAWVKANIALVLSASIGFLIGLRVSQ